MTEAWRTWAWVIVLIGCAGTGLELLLLGHYEDPVQYTPIVLLGLGLTCALLGWRRPTPGIIRATRALMTAFLLAGGLGIYFHLESNVEFELEMRPNMAGLELVMETLTGAIPALAPGAMVQIGLIGLLACFRHPVLDRGTGRERDDNLEA